MTTTAQIIEVVGIGIALLAAFLVLVVPAISVTVDRMVPVYEGDTDGTWIKAYASDVAFAFRLVCTFGKAESR